MDINAVSPYPLRARTTPGRRRVPAPDNSGSPNPNESRQANAVPVRAAERHLFSEQRSTAAGDGPRRRNIPQDRLDTATREFVSPPAQRAIAAYRSTMDQERREEIANMLGLDTYA